jgi:hypothetical protein
LRENLRANSVLTEAAAHLLQLILCADGQRGQLALKLSQHGVIDEFELLPQLVWIKAVHLKRVSRSNRRR